MLFFYFATGSAHVQVRARNGTMTHQMPDGEGDKPMQAKRAAFAHHEWAGPGI